MLYRQIFQTNSVGSYYLVTTTSWFSQGKWVLQSSRNHAYFLMKFGKDEISWLLYKWTAKCWSGSAGSSNIISCVNVSATKKMWFEQLVKFIKHSRNHYLKLDVSTSIRGLHQKKLVLSSSSYGHDRKTPCQESGHVCGSVGRCFITVHSLLSFLLDVYGLFDPPGKMLWLSVDHRRLRTVE